MGSTTFYLSTIFLFLLILLKHWIEGHLTESAETFSPLDPNAEFVNLRELLILDGFWLRNLTIERLIAFTVVFPRVHA